MGRGKILTDFEKGQITAFKSQNISNNKIAKLIGRSRSVVDHYVKDPDKYNIKIPTGRPSILNSPMKRRLFRELSSNPTSLNQLRSNCDIQASKWTIGRTLRNSKIFKYVKMCGAPNLTEAHKRRREEWAKEKLALGDKWKQVIFSDEKKFNLDGPDGFKFYWHDLRKEKRQFSQRGFGGGNVMVWAAIGIRGKSQIAFVSNKMNSEDYQGVLQQFLLPVAKQISGNAWLFQQDNASIHSSTSTTTWLTKKKVIVIDWPARSPDLNIMENLWGILSRRVYENGKQYKTVGDLRVAIEREWDAIDIIDVKTLYDSMLQRVAKVATRRGEFLS